MSPTVPPFFVITGGPGAGKTTLAQALAQSGVAIVPEAARHVIQTQRLVGGRALPWIDPGLYAEVCFQNDVSAYMNTDRSRVTVFDRGVPDIVGYLTLIGRPIPDHFEAAVELFRYQPTVFLAPHWPEIYVTDSERHQDIAEAERTYHNIKNGYENCGYRLISLPRASVRDRVAFVKAHIDDTTSLERKSPEPQTT